MQYLPVLLGIHNDAGDLRVQALRLFVAVIGEPKARARAGACLPPLVALLGTDQLAPSLAEHAALALLLLARDSPANRSLIIGSKGKAVFSLPLWSLCSSLLTLYCFQDFHADYFCFSRPGQWWHEQQHTCWPFCPKTTKHDQGCAR